jgi:glycosyltransferase involved in cell wall biosynthesis
VDPDSPGEFADAIVRILTDHEYRAGLVNRGLQYAAKMNWKHVADSTADIYYEIMRNTR